MREISFDDKKIKLEVETLLSIHGWVVQKWDLPHIEIIKRESNKLGNCFITYNYVSANWGDEQIIQNIKNVCDSLQSYNRNNQIYTHFFLFIIMQEKDTYIFNDKLKNLYLNKVEIIKIFKEKIIKTSHV